MPPFNGSVWRTRSTGMIHRSMNCPHIGGGMVESFAVDDLTEEGLVATFGTKACTTCFPSAPVARKAPDVQRDPVTAGYLEWTHDPGVPDQTWWWQDAPDGEPHFQIVLSQSNGGWWWEVMRYDEDFVGTEIASGGPETRMDRAEQAARRVVDRQQVRAFKLSVRVEGRTPYDEKKHQRGGNPKNKGQFSKKPGGGSTPSKGDKPKDKGTDTGGDKKAPETTKAQPSGGGGKDKAPDTEGDTGTVDDDTPPPPPKDLKPEVLQALIAHKPDPSTTGIGSKNDPVKTSNVEDAAVALQLGLHVELDQPKTVSTLLDKLKEQVDAAKASGEDFNIDLCNVTVQGTNLFCTESKGIPRIKMPQLKVKASKFAPDSRAVREGLPVSEKGEIDLQPLFLQHLKDQGYTAEETQEVAANLKATQNQLDGGKIAGMTQKLEEGGSLGDEPIFVSDDDYIVDGHHRWAANVAADYSDGQAGDYKMTIWRINCDIISLLAMSNDFAAEWGAPQAAVHASLRTRGCTSCGPTLDEMNAHARRKMAMADRSGIPEVDRLIEEFLDESLAERDWGEGAGTVRDLMDGARSFGMCQVITEQFVEFAKARGFKAYATDTDRREMNYRTRGKPPGGNTFFYFEHTVAAIYPPESWPNDVWPNGHRGEVYVDFSASQYGYKDHPKVTTAKTAATFKSFGQVHYAEVDVSEVSSTRAIMAYVQSGEIQMPLGFITWDKTDKTIELVGVDPTARRLGIATELVAKALQVEPGLKPTGNRSPAGTALLKKVWKGEIPKNTRPLTEREAEAMRGGMLGWLMMQGMGGGLDQITIRTLGTAGSSRKNEVRTKHDRETASNYRLGYLWPGA